MSVAGGNFLKLFFSLNVLLMFIPLSLYLEYFRPQAHTLIFFSACLGIIPLAGWMGKATEQIADRAGEGIGGLLNATFGNAAELIIAIVALPRRLPGHRQGLSDRLHHRQHLAGAGGVVSGGWIALQDPGIQCHLGPGPGPDVIADLGGHHHPGPVPFLAPG